MTNYRTPAIWLILCIVGLPQLSETVYTPALPAIARALDVSASLVEYTLTIYLFGFAVGTLFWGKVSDQYGRKPCIILGLLVFLLGCMGCYASQSITGLLGSRFVQAFGGSIGSVLAQSICRDAFKGPDLSRVYVSIAGALAFFPAAGPVIGGILSQKYGWRSVFLFLLLAGMVVLFLVWAKLSETHQKTKRQKNTFLSVAPQLFKNPRVIGFAIIVAGCNGIYFSYFAEGAFFLIKLLGLSPSVYGLSFLGIALSTVSGGLFLKKLQQKYAPMLIIRAGLYVMLSGSSLMTLMIGLGVVFHFPNSSMVVITIMTMFVIMFGSCMSVSLALANALIEYKWCIGTASSLFGFFYYCLISGATLAMAALHNGTLFPMPLYFLFLCLVMLGGYYGLIKHKA